MSALEAHHATSAGMQSYVSYVFIDPLRGHDLQWVAKTMYVQSVVFLTLAIQFVVEFWL